MRMRRNSLLLWCGICLFVVCTFLPMAMFSTTSQLDQEREELTGLVKHWEIAFGADKPEDAQWLPLNNETKALLDGYEGTIWMKRPMSDLYWSNPYLTFSLMKRFEVFLGDEKIYSFNMDNQLRHINPMRMMHPVQIDSDFAGKPILIHAIWEGDPLFGEDLVLMGELDQLLYILILSELAFIIYGLLIITVGIIGLVMFIRRRELIFGWFTLFCIAMGCMLLHVCRSLQWFADMKDIYFWGMLCTPLGIWACMGFYMNALNVGRRLYVRIAHYAIGLYTAFAVFAAISQPQLFRQMTEVGNAVIAIVVFITVSYALAHHAYQRRGMKSKDEMGQEWQWLLRGCWTFGIGALTSVIVYSFFPTMFTELLYSNRYAFRVIEGLLPNVLFLFIICMVMVTVGRVQRIYLVSESNAAELLIKNKELEQFHRNLEQLVEQRTSELERANRTLAVTMREKAETLAEISVLEERNRIAYEMHDVVGHTLTAAIVQLEATRRLAAREGSVPLDKLELLDELVRKGLDDIRRAVRMMKTDEGQQLTLEESLRELIQYAEDTMEIKVESEIVLPRELSLGKVTEGVLYHALQEGLTNGIRHGGSSSFCFNLKCEDSELRFLLVSDGEPFEGAVPGFGLSSMMERVELLGGSVSLSPSFMDDGSPVGCQLAIVIPLS